ncbi:ITP family protein [Megaselia abdita]
MCSRNLKISVVLILVLVPIISSLPRNHNRNHTLSKRSTFFDLECKGIYNKSMFFRLDRICEDCYQLFRETSVHKFCKHKCFTGEFFKACIDALHLTDEIETIKNYVKIINGASPPPTASPSS